MAKKNRDYKAEYAARSERARAKGYSGYGQLRHIKEYNRERAKDVVDRLGEVGLLEYFDEDHDLFDTEIFWQAFRNYYGKGSSS
jgi:hypothetical protein